jgi:hypothetical protein
LPCPPVTINEANWWRKKLGSPTELSMLDITPPTPKWPPAWGLRDMSVYVIVSLEIVILLCNYTFPHRSIVGICVAVANIAATSFDTRVIVDIA